MRPPPISILKNIDSEARLRHFFPVMKIFVLTKVKKFNVTKSYKHLKKNSRPRPARRARFAGKKAPLAGRRKERRTTRSRTESAHFEANATDCKGGAHGQPPPQKA